MLADLLQQPLEGLDADAVWAACAHVRSTCGWHIAPVATMTVPADVATSGYVNLPSLRVVDVAAVTNVPGALPFSWDAGLQELRVARSWRRRRVLVTLTHGYDECPEDLRQAIATMAAAGGGQRVRSESAGPYRAEYFDEGPASAATVARYALPVVA